MRFIIRSFLLSYISLKIAEYSIDAFDFGDQYTRSFMLLMLAITLLNMFMIPLFKILSLPHFGIGFIFLNIVLTLVVLYTLTLFLPDFSIVETTLAELRIFGFVLPSKELTATWAVVYSGLCVSLVYHFIEWLFEKR